MEFHIIRSLPRIFPVWNFMFLCFWVNYCAITSEVPGASQTAGLTFICNFFPFYLSHWNTEMERHIFLSSGIYTRKDEIHVYSSLIYWYYWQINLFQEGFNGRVKWKWKSKMREVILKGKICIEKSDFQVKVCIYICIFYILTCW